MQKLAFISQAEHGLTVTTRDLERLLRRNSIAAGVAMSSLYCVPFLIEQARRASPFQYMVDDLLRYALVLFACVGWGLLWHRIVWSVYMRLGQRAWRIGTPLSRYFGLQLALGTLAIGVMTGVLFLFSRIFRGYPAMGFIAPAWLIVFYTTLFHAVLHPAFVRYALRWG